VPCSKIWSLDLLVFLILTCTCAICFQWESHVPEYQCIMDSSFSNACCDSFQIIWKCRSQFALFDSTTSPVRVLPLPLSFPFSQAILVLICVHIFLSFLFHLRYSGFTLQLLSNYLTSVLGLCLSVEVPAILNPPQVLSQYYNFVLNREKNTTRLSYHM
jgi:hypothetical protein